MKPVIPCHSVEALQWFLQRTQVSVVHAGVPLPELFPKDLHGALSDFEDSPDLAIATSEVLGAYVAKAVTSGDTFVFRNEEVVARVPGFIASSSDGRVIELFAQLLIPDVNNLKRSLIVKAVVSQVRRAASLRLVVG